MTDGGFILFFYTRRDRLGVLSEIVCLVKIINGLGVRGSIRVEANGQVYLRVLDYDANYISMKEFFEKNGFNINIDMNPRASQSH